MFIFPAVFECISALSPLRYQRLSDAGAGQLRLLPTIPQGSGEDPGGAVSLVLFPENLQGDSELLLSDQ